MESKKTNYVSPLRYPGGKACLTVFMKQIIDDNDLIGNPYYEPYAGGAGLALKLLFEEYVSEIHINDFDYAIYSFWYSLINHSDEFCNWLQEVEISIENWRKFKEIYKNQGNYSQFEIAQATFFLNRTNVSGVLQGGVIGGQDQRGNYKINARFNKSDLLSKFRKINRFKKRIKIYNLDGKSLINEYASKDKNALIYIDPPYVNKGSNLYMNYFKADDHLALYDEIAQTKSNWIVSYDTADLIIDTYKDYRRVKYNLSQNTSNRVGEELLVFGPNITYDNAINHLSNSIELISNA